MAVYTLLGSDASPTIFSPIYTTALHPTPTHDVLDQPRCPIWLIVMPHMMDTQNLIEVQKWPGIIVHKQ
eukprot:638619-Ditylum_brightwellii.AAC.1